MKTYNQFAGCEPGEMARFVDTAESILKYLVSSSSVMGEVAGQDRFGFRLSVKVNSLPDAPAMLIVQIGRSLKEKLRGQFDLSQEKGNRLADNVHNGHRTSAESRDPDHKKYGGAALGLRYNASISGLKEEHDTAAALALLVEMGDLEQEKALEVANTVIPDYAFLVVELINRPRGR